jgi:hypothetical protein
LPDPLIDEFERLIRRDPARRGLIGSESIFAPLGPGQLHAAAEELAASARRVGIVTGFFIPAADPPAAETDGPPGAIVLARALESLGIQTWLITDEPCAPALQAIVAAADFPADRVIVFPVDCAATFDQHTGLIPDGLTHLIAIERVGPCHTPESLAAQSCADAPLLERFTAAVSADHCGCCHNMRGEIIDPCTAPLHLLFENRRDGLKTIGIGDGGNEIGMGSLPWDDLCRRLSGPHAAWVPCRTATDWTIIAGTSNWGGSALAASTLLLRGGVDVLRPWDREHEERLLRAMVENGPAVDGVTRRREPTIDGLPFLTYIQPWEGMRRLLGLDG